jgi:D-psicose/D-tagatose/L-ribulose 3-epimerase
MRFGVNTQIWVAPFQQSDLGLIDRVAELGFGYIELGFFTAEPPFSVADVRERLATHGMACGICSFLGAEHDITSTDPDIRKAGIEFMKAMVANTAALGGEVLSGPLYAELFRRRYLSKEDREAERERGVRSLREIARSAEIQGVDIALEPLNRFETDFLNLSEQAVSLAEDVANPALGILLDTFHMAIEEKDQAAAIRRAGKHLKHFHACENDRGSPGTGQVAWTAVRDALRSIGYDRNVVIEGFNPEIVGLANGACIWRPMAPTPDRLAGDGGVFLKKLFS